MASKLDISLDLKCKSCNETFKRRTVGSGLQRLFCSDDCKNSDWAICSTEGCGKKSRAKSAKFCNGCYSQIIKARSGKCLVHKCNSPAIRVGHKMCENHYNRMMRTGSTELRPRPTSGWSKGYKIIYEPEHPITQKSNGWMFEHRKVAYEKYGPGAHECHWCSKKIDWSSNTVDHVNNDKKDNSPDNLVLSCSPCNAVRGSMQPFIKRLTTQGLEDFKKSLSYMRNKR